MNENAFDSGVVPGGMFKTNDVLLLVCYILSICEKPLTIEELSEITIATGMANFFEAGNALSSLVRRGNAYEQDGGYLLTDNARAQFEQLVNGLSYSARKKVANYMQDMYAAGRETRGSKVSVTECGEGYTVKCTVIDKENNAEIMNISMYVPDEAAANDICERFSRHITMFYQSVSAIMTGDITLCQNQQ